MGSTMMRAIRILTAVALTLAAFGAVMYAFSYTIFRFSLGYIRSDVVFYVVAWVLSRSDVFYIATGVLFVCTTFLVNAAWQAFCSRFFTKRSN